MRRNDIFGDLVQIDPLAEILEDQPLGNRQGIQTAKELVLKLARSAVVNRCLRNQRLHEAQ